MYPQNQIELVVREMIASNSSVIITQTIGPSACYDCEIDWKIHGMLS